MVVPVSYYNINYDTDIHPFFNLHLYICIYFSSILCNTLKLYDNVKFTYLLIAKTLRNLIHWIFPDTCSWKIARELYEISMNWGKSIGKIPHFLVLIFSFPFPLYMIPLPLSQLDGHLRGRNVTYTNMFSKWKI